MFQLQRAIIKSTTERSPGTSHRVHNHWMYKDFVLLLAWWWLVVAETRCQVFNFADFIHVVSLTVINCYDNNIAEWATSTLSNETGTQSWHANGFGFGRKKVTWVTSKSYLYSRLQTDSRQGRRIVTCRPRRGTNISHYHEIQINLKVMYIILNFYCCFTVHFYKFKTSLPTNALFIKT
jgi:hypothetical protein